MRIAARYQLKAVRYSEDNVLGVLKNIGRGEYYAAQLFLDGFAPFTPWHDKDFVLKFWEHEFTVDMFYEYSMAWLRVSDCVFIVPDVVNLKKYQDSKGTLKEIAEAERLGIPVFYEYKNLLEWSKLKR